MTLCGSESPHKVHHQALCNQDPCPYIGRFQVRANNRPSDRRSMGVLCCTNHLTDYVHSLGPSVVVKVLSQ